MAITKRVLSGSTDGRVIPVAATGTPGTLIHTAIAGTLGIDEIFLFASNVTIASVRLTIQWGGVGDPSDHLTDEYVVPPNSPPFIVSPGLVLRNSLVVRAFVDTASGINISGFVNRIE